MWIKIAAPSKKVLYHAEKKLYERSSELLPYSLGSGPEQFPTLSACKVKTVQHFNIFLAGQLCCKYDKSMALWSKSSGVELAGQ